MTDQVWGYKDGVNKFLEESGGGSSSFGASIAPVNISSFATLDSGNGWSHQFQSGELSLGTQPGSDLSIGDGVTYGGGAVFSATGGWFQFGVYLQPPTNVTLDGGTTTPRYLWVGAVGGEAGAPNVLFSFGLDAFVPISDDAALQQSFSVTQVSTPVFVLPGGPVMQNINLFVAGATGSDAIANPQNALGGFGVWQCG